MPWNASGGAVPISPASLTGKVLCKHHNNLLSNLDDLGGCFFKVLNSIHAASHVTVWRWVQRYGPEMEQRLRRRLKPTNDSWRVDETYIRVKGKWVYLYRAVDSTGATIDFLLSTKRDVADAERFLAKALGGEKHPAPRVINTDKHAAYPPAIAELKADGVLDENSKHRPVQYLNNILEQDHRASNAGCAQANIFVRSGELGVLSPATKRFI